MGGLLGVKGLALRVKSLDPTVGLRVKSLDLTWYTDRVGKLRFTEVPLLYKVRQDRHDAWRFLVFSGQTVGNSGCRYLHLNLGEIFAQKLQKLRGH